MRQQVVFLRGMLKYLGVETLLPMQKYLMVCQHGDGVRTEGVTLVVNVEVVKPIKPVVKQRMQKMSELTIPQLKAIFGGDKESPAHKVFQKNWKPSVGDEVIGQWDKTVVRDVNTKKRHLYLKGAKLGEEYLVDYDKVTFIPSVEQLREMSEMDWLDFNANCRDKACDLVWIRQIPNTAPVPWLLAVAMVVMGDKAKWDGKEWIK